MFCPRCATQNLDDAKFCRACGTNLVTVALALADKYHPAKDESKTKDPFENWLETRKEAVNKIVHGIGWFMSSLLIGLALGLFSNTNDWIIIWTGLAGWMAVLGIFSMFSGTASLMESRFLRRQLGKRSGDATPPRQALPAGERLIMNDTLTTPVPSPQTSVTEQTTTRLIKPERTTKPVG